MAAGIVTPLQLTAAAGLLDNQGIKPIPSALAAALAAFNATTVISNFLAAVSYYKAQSFANQSTLISLLSIGNSVCPALGNSIPAAPLGSYPYLNAEYLTTPFDAADGSTLDPSGFSELIRQTASAYLGDGDAGKFAQGFMAVQGYINITNQFINSAVNAQTYLGPTFTNWDAIITNNVSNLNSNFDGFAQDLYQQGQLWNLSEPLLYGTPAGLLQQLAAVGRLRGGFFGDLQTALTAQGLTAETIQQLIRGQEQLTLTQFNQLQLLAYQAMLTVTGDSLDQVLAILDVTLPNIVTMADLLNPVKTFPTSYTTLQVPAGTVWQPIYNPGTSVNLAVAPLVNAVLPAASGCDELAKVIPPDQAVANRAIALGLQQLTGLPLTNLPALAQAVHGLAATDWNPETTYLANETVNNGSPGLVVYRAQQDVPAGVDITDTNYWLPTSLGGISTLSGLPLLQNQATPLASSVNSYFTQSVATGSGPNGTITTCDVIGLAIDYDDFAAQLNTATTTINALQTAGSLTALNQAYTDIVSASNNSQVVTYIGDANTAIAALSGDPNVTVLNTAWVYMANLMNKSAQYLSQGTVDYFELPAGDKVSVMALVQNFAQYGSQNNACGPAEFLNSVADTATLTGQAIVGSLREANNSQRLTQAGLGVNIMPSAEPAVTPVPAVIPVY